MNSKLIKLIQPLMKVGVILLTIVFGVTFIQMSIEGDKVAYGYTSVSESPALSMQTSKAKFLEYEIRQGTEQRGEGKQNASTGITKDIMLLTDASYVKTICGYFDLYDAFTYDIDAICKDIDIASIRANYTDPYISALNKTVSVTPLKLWASFSALSGSNSIAYARNQINIGEVDWEHRTYRGRYMIAVGAHVTMDDSAYYEDRMWQAGDVKYGSFIDIVVREKETDELFIIPCVNADCKMHTYPGGYVQSGIKITGVNRFEDESTQHADGSSVEFQGVKTESIGAVQRELNTKYELVRIIVYSQERSKVDWR